MVKFSLLFGIWYNFRTCYVSLYKARGLTSDLEKVTKSCECETVMFNTPFVYTMPTIFSPSNEKQ